ncbi:hypothetical protein PHMEG_0002393 [Phytophthora megakarya]|uniref:Reverse transcriptase n=1 Tax=Phytophthora megakarya TaxID=4795 RepID=A0A225X0T4_9STRA|nr:hypothetical protein PHMEG_0002393 [Phytophthora megakarya]
MLVDPEVLEFLGISPEASDAPISQGTERRGGVSRISTNTVIHQNRVAPEQMGPVLARNDIIYGDPSWGDLCKTQNALLYRLRYRNISVSLPKREFGVKKCKYLGHDINSDGIRNYPKLAEMVLLNLSFPMAHKVLNYYANFIEDLPVLVATLYEVPDEQLCSERDLEKPKYTFDILKDWLVWTQLLQHPDPGRQYDYDGTIPPVLFLERVFQDAELGTIPSTRRY